MEEPRVEETKRGGKKARGMQREEDAKKTKSGHNEVEMKSRGKKERNRRRKTSKGGCKSKNQQPYPC